VVERRSAAASRQCSTVPPLWVSVVLVVLVASRIMHPVGTVDRA